MALALWAVPAAAHEFWIDPQAHRVAPGAPLVADLRVGEMFDGPAYAYLPPTFERFDIVMGGAALPVQGRPGDRPALDMAVPWQGLAVVVHVTTDMTLVYDGWDRFAAFAVEKDATWALARHDARGLPRDAVRERYSRHAKALVAVGDGAGADRELGLAVELVALANPYVDDVARGLHVMALAAGAPRADAQVTLFARAPDGTVTRTHHRTDAQGRAVLPVAPGHAYLADHVVLREIAPDGPDGSAWESLWASLTFAVPE